MEHAPPSRRSLRDHRRCQRQLRQHGHQHRNSCHRGQDTADGLHSKCERILMMRLPRLLDRKDAVHLRRSGYLRGVPHERRWLRILLPVVVLAGLAAPLVGAGIASATITGITEVSQNPTPVLTGSSTTYTFSVTTNSGTGHPYIGTAGITFTGLPTGMTAPDFTSLAGYEFVLRNQQWNSRRLYGPSVCPVRHDTRNRFVHDQRDRLQLKHRRCMRWNH